MSNSKKYLLLTLALSLASLGLFALKNSLNLWLPSVQKPSRLSMADPSNITITASKKSAAGVEADTAFLLSSLEPLDSQKLTQSLKIVPALDFKVNQKTDKEYEIIPAAPLEEAKIYRLTLSSLVGGVEARDHSWAFQVKSPLSIVGSYPGNESTHIPTNASVEVYFNTPEVGNDLSKYFEITPKVDGRFEKHQNSLVFVHDGLSPSTLYTVTVKAGVSLSDNSQKLEKDYSFQFETSSQAKESEKRFHFSQTIFETTADQKTILTIDSVYDSPSLHPHLRLYQLSQSQFLECLKEKSNIPQWSYYFRYRHRCQPPSPAQSEFDLELKSVSDYGRNYLELPELLNQTYYLVEIDNPNTSPSQALLQVSPFTWYYWLGSREGVLWANSAVSQKPLSKVNLSVNGRSLGSTDETGLVKFQTNFQSEDRLILSLESQNKTLYNIVDINSPNAYYFWGVSPSDKTDTNNYWSYLYTDRSLYQPQDKVNFWGIVKNRQNQIPQKIVAKLLPPRGWFDEEKSVEPVSQIELSPSRFGTFQGSFDLRDLSPGWYTISVYENDTPIQQRGFSVETYSKPAFKLTVKPEKLVVKAGDTNRFIIQASFYDGTPLANTALAWNSWGADSKKGEVVTDVTGRAVVEAKTSYRDDPKVYWPENISVDVYPKDNQESEIRSYSSFYSFGSDLNLSQESKWDASSSTIKGALTLKKYDYQKLVSDPWSKDHPSVPGQLVKLTITKQWSEKIEDGEYYDPINKINQKKYRYELRSQDVGSQELTTDSQGKAVFSFPAEAKSEYRLLFSALDQGGRTGYLNTYVHASTYGYRNDSQLNIESDRAEYQTDNQVKISLSSDSQPLPDNGSHRYLFFIVREGKVIAYNVGNQNTYNFQFVPEYIPNVYVRSVWYNGQTYLEPNSWHWFNQGLKIKYDEKQRQVNLNIKADKSKYLPGETVNLQVEAKDIDKRPQVAKIIVSVVDVALESLGGLSEDDILTGLYYPLSEGSLTSYSSHLQNFMPEAGGAEGGGGGGDRTDFKDTAFFKEVETDRNGIAKVSFKLPDNITSWRLGALAVTNELFAGSEHVLLPVSKPMFVSIVSSDEFVKADRPRITAIAYGDSLREGAEISYNLKSASLGLDLNQKGVAFKPLEFDLGQLKIGRHQLRLEGTSDDKKDAVVRQITITDSRLLLPKSEYLEVNSKYQPSWDTSSPAKVTLIDKSRGYWYPYLQSLSGLCHFGDNERLDRIAAQYLSSDLLQKYFQEEVPETTIPAIRYQQEDGFALLPGSDADIFLTARIAAANLPAVNRPWLQSSLQKSFLREKDITRASAALWGLAELGLPELNTIQSLAGQKNTPLGKIYLGLAAATLGDETTAHRLLAEVLDAHLVQQSPYQFIQIGNDSTINRQITSLTSVLTAKLNDFEQTTAFWNYLQSSYSRDNLVVLEQALGLNHLLQSLPSTSTVFSYTHQGKKTQKTLSEGESYQIILNPADIKDFSLEPVSGQLSLVARWWQKTDPSAVNPSTQASVSIRLSSPSPLTIGDFVDIFVDYKLSSNPSNQPFLVTLNLPSTLRYVNSPYTYRPLLPNDENHYSWPYQVNGNQLTFWLPPAQPEDNQKDPIRLLVRSVNKGNFIFEPAIIYGFDSPETINFSPSLGNIIVE